MSTNCYVPGIQYSMSESHSRTVTKKSKNVCQSKKSGNIFGRIFFSKIWKKSKFRRKKNVKNRKQSGSEYCIIFQHVLGTLENPKLEIKSGKTLVQQSYESVEVHAHSAHGANGHSNDVCLIKTPPMTLDGVYADWEHSVTSLTP